MAANKASVYTQRFLLWDGGAGVSIWEVPAGYRAVIRSVVTFSDTAGSGVNLVVAGCLVWLWSAPGAYTGEGTAMHLAVYAGETISVQRVGGRTGGAVTGFIFEDSAGPLGRHLEHLRREGTPLPSSPT